MIKYVIGWKMKRTNEKMNEEQMGNEKRVRPIIDLKELIP